MLTEQQKDMIKRSSHEFVRAHITDYIDKTDIILSNGSHVNMIDLNTYECMLRGAFIMSNRRNYKDLKNYYALLQSTGLKMEDSPDKYPDAIRDYFYQLIELMNNDVSPFSEKALDTMMLFIILNCQ